MTAKVFFTNPQTDSRQSLLDKLERLFDQAEMGKIVAPGDLVAIKMHFGEPGNLAYIRPPYIRRLVDKLKGLGGRPFLTDANTLYRGRRANAVDHLESAVLNGFDYAVAGAPLIIADGLVGKDYVKVNIEGVYFKEVHIGSAAYHADSMLVVSHFKGHDLSGFGGAIKNLGMGLGSRSGKQQMHSDVLPQVRKEKCKGCLKCQEWCPAGAVEIQDKKAVIDEGKCWGCGECTVTCRHGAIKISWRTTPRSMQEKMAEYALGATANKKGKIGFITFLTDVSPNCDCNAFNDVPVVHDIGIMAGYDPVAMDQACVDLVNRAEPAGGSVIEGLTPGYDKFGALYPGIDWRFQLEHAEKIELGTRKYEIIEV